MPKKKNDHRKTARAARWAGGQSRRQARVRRQRDQEQASKALRAAGELTPWEQACQARAERRAKKTGEKDAA